MIAGATRTEQVVADVSAIEWVLHEADVTELNTTER